MLVLQLLLAKLVNSYFCPLEGHSSTQTSLGVSLPVFLPGFIPGGLIQVDELSHPQPTASILDQDVG